MKTIIVIFLLSIASWSQNTAVSGQVTDPDGQTWNNGTYSINFVPTPGIPGPFSWNGTTNFPQKFTGTLDSSGNISITIPDNNFVKPLGTQWRFTLCSNTSAPCQDVVTPVSGSSINLGSTFLTNLVAPRFGAGNFAHGYLDLEVNGSLPPGSTYFNVTTLVMRVWTGSIWQPITGGGGGGGVTGSGTPGDFALWATTTSIGDSQLSTISNQLIWNGNQGICANASCGTLLGNRFTSYNNTNVVGNGVPAVVGAQQGSQFSANMSATNIGPLIPASSGFLARISCYNVITTAATTSSTLPNCQASWTDAQTSTVETQSFGSCTPNCTNNTVGTYINGDIVVQAKVGTHITVSSTGYATSGATSMVWQNDFVVELF